MEQLYYNQISLFENLYQAHCKARKGKREKKEVIEYEIDLGQNLSRLQYQLKNFSYKMLPYRDFWIKDPKPRHIYATRYRDRIVQHSICDNVLEPYMERHLIYDNAASRLGKGTHFAMRRLTQFMRKFYRKYKIDGYILKCDIRKFYDSIDHERLYRIYKKAFSEDEAFLWLLKMIIDSYEVKEGKGLPLGNQTSSWFALYYLNEMDRIIKEQMRIKYYTRYMDDFILLHYDKEYLKECLEKIRLYLTDTGKVIRKLRTSNKKRMKRKLKRFRHAYREGKIDFSSITRSIYSYQGHLSHGHTYHLRKNILNHLILTKGGNEKC